MEDTAYRAIAIVGVGAVLPDAPNAPAFWKNVKEGRYSITEVTPDRWNPDVYYDPDPKFPDKSYSKIGGWVRQFTWDPMAWHLPIPPRVSQAMDDTQKWAVACTHEALSDYGYPTRPINLERTAVILGNAMAGERHYVTSTRLAFPEFARELGKAPAFATLPPQTRDLILREFHANCNEFFPEITEDTMPGELSNCIAGRVANSFNFHGPNFVCDAACASAMAAMSAAIEGLIEKDFDFVVTGGIDRNMGVGTFVKFCKIGALSATGTRPYADGSDGFVMGEGAGVFLLKRLEDAERDGDKIYAVLRGVGGSSDGRGKGITAPNPIGQRLAIERGWKNAGLDPATATLIEGHGTSTRVGDVVEVQSLTDVFSSFNPTKGSIALGSVKSNIGHLKGAAGAAGLLKAVMALYEKVLPPSLNFKNPNPNIDWASSSFYVNTELRPWQTPPSGVRRAGLSAFGFGGTNFHMVLEEYIPGRLKPRKIQTSGFEEKPVATGSPSESLKAPLRGALVMGGAKVSDLATRLQMVLEEAKAGKTPQLEAPLEADLHAPERLAIDYADAHDLVEKGSKALKALEANNPAMWKALRAQGVFRGSGPAPKVAFLYTGQGSQYVNMLTHLRKIEPIVTKVFEEADQVMTPLLGKPLSEYIFVDKGDEEAVTQAEHDLRQTAITQPAVLAVDSALTKLMASYGIKPDMVMGHSLGEYGALVAAEAMPLADALEAVSARGREMTKVSMGDNGKMAAVFAPIEEVERILKTINGYVVLANINSASQSVIGGASQAVTEAEHVFRHAGYNVVPLSVSHAFHTTIVAPASAPLRQTLERLRLQAPKIPTVANVDGEFYPTSGNDVVTQMLDILAKQVASPVQFVKGLHTLYDAGVRVFVEVGPKKALQGFVDDLFGSHPEVISLATNHPKIGDVASFNQALCGLYAAGFGVGRTEPKAESNLVPAVSVAAPVPTAQFTNLAPFQAQPVTTVQQSTSAPNISAMNPQNSNTYLELGKLFVEFLDRGMQLYSGQSPRNGTGEPVVITGAALGLPGGERIFDDQNVSRILHGEQFIDLIPSRYRRSMVEKHITRLVKSEAGASFETIESTADVIKLAARGGKLDLEHEFGISADRIPALDEVTKMAIGAGIDALRDAGIPMVLHYKTTTRGTQLPDKWCLPDSMKDDTGIIFASAFPGYDSFADNISRFWIDHTRHEELGILTNLRARLNGAENSTMASEIDRRITELKDAIEKDPYTFDRRFLFRVLAMGHSQFAELIGARGPNTQINSACASTTQAVALAEDWIHAGRCRRVIVIAADDVTSDHLLEWFGSGFLASGAAATDDVVEEAATPFDRRRHGMILGMGAAAIVVESSEAARERGIQPICEVMSAVTANSAFHGTRLDVNHICQVMEKLVSQAEARFGVNRYEIAPKMVFVSHETYTPARGGSAAAEIHALREVFGPTASQIVIANTKGFTGHPMGVGIEDVVAIKALETGLVPPVPNYKEVDPDLGVLNLSKGGAYPVQYALRLGAGFGSQISMSLIRWVPTRDGMHRNPNALGFDYRVADQNVFGQWLSQVSGYPTTNLEIVHRTLRVKDQGAPTHAVEPQPVVKPALPAPTAPIPVVQAAPVVEQPPVANVETPLPPPAPLPVPAPVAEPVKAQIVQLVSQQTGYPPDMLDLSLDMEADLGIDTVKQAEIFATIRESYNIPRDDKLKLRDYPTLNHVIGFVYERRPDLKAAAQPVPVAPPKPEVTVTPAPVPAPTVNPVKVKVLELASAKTGYPIDMLDLDLDLEADLGIDTVKQAELFASVRESFNIPRLENLRLRDFPTLKHVIGFVMDHRPDLKEVVVAPPQPPEPISLPATAPPVVSDPVKEEVLKLASTKTGYPMDMLDLDLDLEADLGVDTVKQAEMFASVRESFNIPRQENLRLRDFPTLKHVIGFVYQNRPDLKVPVSAPVVQPAPAPAPIETAPVPVTPPTADDPVKQKVLALAADKTGYPIDMLDLDLDLEADLGVDTVKQAEMFASVRGMFDIPRDENRKLRDFPTLKHVIQFVYDQRPDLKATGDGHAPQAIPVAPATPIQIEVPSADVDDVVKQKVVAMAVEKTGYPEEMLGLELDLEADLGIDTVKQAEMFASVREAFGIPRDENRKLRDFPTLKHVIQFVYDHRPDLKKSPDGHKAAAFAIGASAAAAAPALAPIPVPVPTTRLLTFEAANQVPRRVPVPILRPRLSLCKSTSVQLEAGTRVIVMPDVGGVAAHLSELLKERDAEVLMLENGADTEAVKTQLGQWLEAGPIHGVYWLPALDCEPGIPEMDLETWRQSLQVRVKLLYTTMRTLYEQIVAPGTFLISATHLDGQHGYSLAGAQAPLGGAVTGFIKAYKRERTEALVKAVDFPIDFEASELAITLVEETLRDPGVVEIGYANGMRWTIGLEEQPVTDGQPGMKLDQDTVFVITGAAGSIVSAITTDLATASGGIFYLLDLVPEPDPNNPDIPRLTTDKDNLKRDLFERLKARGERATPAMVEKELAGLERASAALTAIQAVKNAGGTAYYFSGDLRDSQSVARIFDTIRQQHGRVDVLLHAAGLEISHFLTDKEQREFDLVFDVKSDGWFNLLKSVGELPLGATVVFSSIAGRFGNGGQTDYSAANDLLCKTTSSFRTTRPNTRGIALDWTAWASIGMAARGSIPKMMEVAGIDMLPPEAGIPLIRRELISGGTRGEQVVANRLGILMNEFDSTGGLDTDAVNHLLIEKVAGEEDGQETVTYKCGPMIGQVTGAGIHTGLVVETVLDPKEQPFLFDHQINATPVLPGVMGMEAFAELATVLLPDWHVAAVENVHFLAPFKFYRHEPRKLKLMATFHPDGDDILAKCCLIGTRLLPNQSQEQATTHFTGMVRLTQQVFEPVKQEPIREGATLVPAETIYKIYFHGPAYQVLESVWKSGEGVTGLFAQGLIENHRPAERPTRTTPRWVELCFQTAGIWEIGNTGHMGLPLHVEKMIPLQNGENTNGRQYAVVTRNTKTNSFDASVCDADGNVFLELQGYQTIEFPVALEEEQVKQIAGALS